MYKPENIVRPIDYINMVVKSRGCQDVNDYNVHKLKSVYINQTVINDLKIGRPLLADEISIIAEHYHVERTILVQFEFEWQKWLLAHHYHVEHDGRIVAD